MGEGFRKTWHGKLCWDLQAMQPQDPFYRVLFRSSHRTDLARYSARSSDDQPTGYTFSWR